MELTFIISAEDDNFKQKKDKTPLKKHLTKMLNNY